MPRSAPNKMPAAVKRRYFELLRTGMSGSQAAAGVGVSLSCGSLWFIDAGSVSFVETPISRRYLSQDDRIEIADGLARGEPVPQIAARIGRSYQTVYREIARNRKPDGRYQPWFAHNQAYLRRRRPKPRRFTGHPDLRDVVAGKLRRRWSPAQISRWLRRRYPRRPAWHVCPETIYDAVYRGLLGCVNPAVATSPRSFTGRSPRRSSRGGAAAQATGWSLLRTGRTYRHRRGRGRTRDGALRQCTTLRSIHDRPAQVESRSQIGHWEGDLIVGSGNRSAVATLVERRTRFTVLVGLPLGHSARAVGDALIQVFADLPAPLRRSLTWDQGNEMFHHDRITHRTGMVIYFADPHSPWQRGSNENTNGLLRQYLPKGADLRACTTAHLARIAAELNDRPRLCLGDQTPHQAMRHSTRHLSTDLTIRDVR